MSEALGSYSSVVEDSHILDVRQSIWGRLKSSRTFEGPKIGRLDTQDEETMIFRNAEKYLTNDIA
jgi:hypothetical protein